jgi:hypothetical protein
MARPIHANLEMPVAPVLARAPLKIEGERGGVGAFPRLPPKAKQKFFILKLNSSFA